jgi:rod shape-determining protein MreD
VIRKYPLYTVLMIVLCLVQHFVISRMVLLHAAPDLLAIFIAFVGMSIGQRTGTTYGFIAGLISGFLTGNIGMAALVGTVQGFVAGYSHVPDDSHATSTQKKRMFYLAVFTALLAGNTIQALLNNPLAQPLIIRILTLVVLTTLITMILSIGVYHLILKKKFTD